MDKSRVLIQGTQHSIMFETLKKCAEVLHDKEADYGRDNFLQASITATKLVGRAVAPSTVVACLVGIKMARYAELTTRGKVPENESLHDTIIDLINYILLMERERRTDEVIRNEANKVEEAD